MLGEIPSSRLGVKLWREKPFARSVLPDLLASNVALCRQVESLGNADSTTVTG
jgi:hypothetical protein